MIRIAFVRIPISCHRSVWFVFKIDLGMFQVSAVWLIGAIATPTGLVSIDPDAFLLVKTVDMPEVSIWRRQLDFLMFFPPGHIYGPVSPFRVWLCLSLAHQEGCHTNSARPRLLNIRHPNLVFIKRVCKSPPQVTSPMWPPDRTISWQYCKENLFLIRNIKDFTCDFRED